MLESAKNNIIIDFVKNKQSLGLAWTVLGFISVLFLMSVGFYLNIELYVLGVVVGLFFAYLLITSPKIWLYSIAFSTGIFYHISREGVSASYVILGILYLGSIALWFIWQLFFLRKKVVKNLGDWLILAFFFFLIFNLLILYLNDGDCLLWLKEYLLFCIILIYFPIRDIIKTEKELMTFLIFYCFITIGSGFFQIYLYYNRLYEDFVYAYQMQHGISVNQTLYTSASIFGFLFTFHQTNKKKELLVLAFTTMAIISLIATFSRTFWVVLAIAIIIFFIMFPLRKKAKMLVYIVSIVSLMAVIGFVFIPDKMYLLVNIIRIRFESSADGTKDLSMMSRLAEWDQVIKKIYEYPLGGNGLAKTFSFYNVIDTTTHHTSIMHNGYLYLMYRTGIPTTLLFFSFIVFYNVKAWDNIVRSTSNNLKAIALSNFAVIISLYITNFTSPQYFFRDGVFVTAFVIAFIEINEKLIKNNKNKSEIGHG